MCAAAQRSQIDYPKRILPTARVLPGIDVQPAVPVQTYGYANSSRKVSPRGVKAGTNAPREALLCMHARTGTHARTHARTHRHARMRGQRAAIAAGSPAPSRSAPPPRAMAATAAAAFSRTQL